MGPSLRVYLSQDQNRSWRPTLGLVMLDQTETFVMEWHHNGGTALTDSVPTLVKHVGCSGTSRQESIPVGERLGGNRELRRPHPVGSVVINRANMQWKPMGSSVKLNSTGVETRCGRTEAQATQSDSPRNLTVAARTQDKWCRCPRPTLEDSNVGLPHPRHGLAVMFLRVR